MKICVSLMTAACVFAVTALAVAADAPPDKRPNIVIILADDMGFSDVGCYGGEIRTPNIDKLAADGMRFTQFYNAAKCAPSRTALLSGLYWQQAERGIKRGITIGQALHATGYSTLAVGKWHLDGNPVDRGFDHWFGFLTGSTRYFLGNETFHLDRAPFSVPQSGFYTTDAFTEYAIRFVEDARKTAPEKPFFLYLAYNAPHDPLQAPSEDIARYKGKYLKGWDKLRQERYERQIALGIIKKEWDLSPRPDNIPAWESLSEKIRQFEDLRASVYAAMIDRMDQDIGRLLAKLKDWNIENNTVVIFLSDNGAEATDRNARRNIPPGGPESRWELGAGWANLSDTPFRLYKRSQHEGGIATPFIVRWPNVIKKGGGITDQPAHLIDIMATCAQLSGCDYAATFQGKPSPPSTGANDASVAAAPIPPLEGKSLVPLFEGKSWDGHNLLFFQLRDHRAIRAGQWKLVSYEGKPWELYRMDTDRTEVHDLARKEPEKLKELDALYNQWWNQPNIIVKGTRHDQMPGYVDPFKGGEEGKALKKERDGDDE